MKLLAITIITTFAIVAMSCGGGSTNQTTNVAINTGNKAPVQTPLPAATVDEVGAGRKVYEVNCAKCHKDNGTGGEVVIEGKKLKADDLTSAKVKGFADDKIIRILMTGIEDEGMPSFKDKLTEGEMRDVVQFIRVELQKMPKPAAPKS
jgi:mono/diheme cytochrome c family protein